MCRDQDKFEEMVTPRYLAELVLQNKAQLCCSVGRCGEEQVELLGEQGLRKVKTKALLFVGTKETKGCVRNE